MTTSVAEKKSTASNPRQKKLDKFAKENGHPPVAEGIICLDFDGTIRPWGGLHEFPEPFTGVVQWVKDVRASGYKVILFTSRLSAVWHEHEGRDIAKGIMDEVDYLRQYCAKYDIEVDGATAEKIPALAYIDDKAIRFGGNWQDTSAKFDMYVGGKFVG